MPQDLLQDFRALRAATRRLLDQRGQQIRSIELSVRKSRDAVAASQRLLSETRSLSPSEDPPPPRSRR